MTAGVQLPPLSRAEIDVLWSSLLVWQAKHMDGPALTREEREAVRTVEVILTEVRNRHDGGGAAR